MQSTDLSEQLASLYTALAGADPLAAPDGAAGAAASAWAVAGAFADATRERQGRYLLRALDEAIAAFEVAARLADAYHGTGATTRAAPPDTSDPLYTDYAAFVAAQPQWQQLYHYRNALAARLGISAPSASTEAGEGKQGQ